MARKIALRGLAEHNDLNDIATWLAPLHPHDNAFLGEVVRDLDADAIGLSRATHHSPLEFEGIRDRYLPDGVAQTTAQNHKSKFALRAAAMPHGGVDPGLLDAVRWWQTDDLWYWSLEAFAACVRANTERTGQSVESVRSLIADEHGVSLTGPAKP